MNGRSFSGIVGKVILVLGGLGVLATLTFGGIETKQYIDAKQRTIPLINGTNYSLSNKPDKKGRLAKEIIECFYGGKSSHDEAYINSLNSNADHIIHLSNGSFFNPKDIIIYRDGDNKLIFTDGFEEKLIHSPRTIHRFSLNELSKARSLDDYVLLHNDVDSQRIYVEPTLIKDSQDPLYTKRLPKLTENSRLVGILHSMYIIETPETGDLFTVPKSPVIRYSDLDYGDKILLRGKPQGLNYSVYHSIKDESSDGQQLLENVINNPKIKVLGLGENSKGPERLGFLEENLNLLKENNYVIGLELSKDKCTELGITVEEFFARYNKRKDIFIKHTDGKIKKANSYQIDQVIDDLFDYDMEKFVKKCHEKQIELIPMEERNAAIDAYFKDPDNFTETRDYFMCKNITEYLQNNPDKKVAMLVGRNHISKKEKPFGVIGEMGKGYFGPPQPVYEYTEDKPLGSRLVKKLGKDKIMSIGLYDGGYMPDLPNFEEQCAKPESHAICEKIRWLRGHLRLTDSRALAYNPNSKAIPYFREDNIDHAVVVLPNRVSD